MVKYSGKEGSSRHQAPAGKSSSLCLHSSKDFWSLLKQFVARFLASHLQGVSVNGVDVDVAPKMLANFLENQILRPIMSNDPWKEDISVLNYLNL